MRQDIEERAFCCVSCGVVPCGDSFCFVLHALRRFAFRHVPLRSLACMNITHCPTPCSLFCICLLPYYKQPAQWFYWRRSLGIVPPASSAGVAPGILVRRTAAGCAGIWFLPFPRRCPLPTPSRRRDANPTTALPVYKTTPPGDRPVPLVVLSLHRRPSRYPSSSSFFQDVLLFSRAKEEGHQGYAYIPVHYN